MIWRQKWLYLAKGWQGEVKIKKKKQRKITFLFAHIGKTRGGASLGKGAKEEKIKSYVFEYVNFELGYSHLRSVEKLGFNTNKGEAIRVTIVFTLI